MKNNFNDIFSDSSGNDLPEINFIEGGDVDFNDFIGEIVSEENGEFKTTFKTSNGEMILGDSLEYMKTIPDNSINLVITSPPYALISKKEYGNEDQNEYVNWFLAFGKEIHRILKDDGSFVLNTGGSWQSKKPAKSLYQFKLLLALTDQLNFHLAQDFYWYNKSVMPGPTVWTSRKRIRVKNAVEYIWWLSKTPWPKASNKRTLTPYDDTMKRVIKQGGLGYHGIAPSGWQKRQTGFDQDNGGAISTNVLVCSHSVSNETYMEYCRKNDITIHPARFPREIPEYFIRMLTEKQDIVIDPFGGSCTVGEICEKLERKWKCIDMNESYLDGAVGRFVRNATGFKHTNDDPHNAQYYDIFKTGSFYPIENPGDLKTGNEQ